MNNVQNIRELRHEWISKWTVSNKLKGYSRIISIKLFRGRATINDTIMNYEQSFKHVPLRRCIAEMRRRGQSMEV